MVLTTSRAEGTQDTTVFIKLGNNHEPGVYEARNIRARAAKANSIRP
jgi:hypothetical protein